MEGAVVLRQLVREIQELWEFYERRQSSSLSMLPSVTLSCLLSLSFVERRGRWKVVEHVYFLASDEFVADAAVFELVRINRKRVVLGIELPVEHRVALYVPKIWCFDYSDDDLADYGHCGLAMEAKLELLNMLEANTCPYKRSRSEKSGKRLFTIPNLIDSMEQEIWKEFPEDLFEAVIARLPIPTLFRFRTNAKYLVLRVLWKARKDDMHGKSGNANAVIEIKEN
ncbi:hypothetical protein HPP92_007010 [Vanilla planifolia]|uniref:Uncharacterized protein n=1 Tax=Vanilla planifolia TaxID=51239 RepID=A0A835V5H3_VANPL|nr:hypothetical protein HPP92_007010 [Vanilla planifolia]